MAQLSTEWLRYDMAEAGRKALGWWVQELAAFLPRQFWAGPGRRSNRLIITITGASAVPQQRQGEARRLLTQATLTSPGDNPASDGWQELIPAGTRRGRTVDVRIGPDAVLRKIVNLPLAAESSLGQALAFEIDRQTPFATDQVYYAWRVRLRDRTAKRLQVELAVVKRSTLDPILQLLKHRQLRLHEISLAAGDAEMALTDFNRGASASHGRGHRWATAALATIALALGLALPATYLLREQSATAALAEQVVRARVTAQASEKLQHEIQQLSARQDFLSTQRRQAAAVWAVNEVARLLPDDTWLFQLEYGGKVIHLHGYSKAAARLIALIDGSPQFEGARFRAPLTQAPQTDSERFDLSFQVKLTDKP